MNNYLFLINDENPLPKCYNVNTCEVENGYCLESTASCYAKRMICCAKKDGIILKIESAFRSIAYQQVLIERDIKLYMDKGFSLEKAIEETMKNIASPGSSEHNAGLALDILSDSYSELDEGFSKTDAYRWLINNSFKFGFILRYPKDKTHITKISYEPWHFRFVGVYHARKIKQSGLTLEEYIKKCK